jgi:transcription elongation factor GreA
MKVIKFTKEGLRRIKAERSRLKILRPAAVSELSRARELGDLSENSLYHAAKARVRSIDNQINRLSNQIKLAKIVRSKRYLVEQNGEQIRYELVGDLEADPSQNKISANSPVGSKLAESNEGDIIQVSTPRNNISLKVLKISK